MAISAAVNDFVQDAIPNNESESIFDLFSTSATPYPSDRIVLSSLITPIAIPGILWIFNSFSTYSLDITSTSRISLPPSVMSFYKNIIVLPYIYFNTPINAKTFCIISFSTYVY